MQNGIAEVAVYNSKDNEDVDWAENRLKKLPDPLAMDNVSIENVKKDVSSSSKAKVEKNPKKRGRKVSSPIYRPSLPKSVKYKIKQIPTHSLRFGSTYNMDFVEDLNLSIGVKGIELFKNTIFGPYLNIPNCNYQGQITKCLLLLELEQDNIDELHIHHASGNILHFTIKEFAIITGLKCTGNVDEFRYPDSTHSRLIQRYFPESKDSVNKGRLVQRFLMGEWENNQDAVEMAILYFIHTFVFSQLGDTNIPIHHFFMVEDGRYQKYPWGQIAFSKLMKTLRQKFTKEKKLYRLAGMPYSLNVWIYECASIISDEIVVKESNYIPRICNWRVVGVKPKFDMFMSSIFTQNACNDIHPTTEEMSALDLPANVNTSPSEPHTSAAKSKQVQPQDLLEFENFSTNHTDQFLRRSRRMSTTSSTPPPKRRRNAHSAKPKVTQVNQPVQLVVQTKHKIPIPDSGGNLSDIHGPSFDRKESSDKSGIKQVKKYLKKYVDKKFQHLEDLIKLNHIELVNAIRNPDKQEEENIVGTSIPTTVSGFQEGHFAHPPSTDQMFEQRSSSIAMDFPNNDPIEVDVVEAQEQNHISEQKAVEDVDTCKDKEGMNDVSDLPHTTDVHDKASVSKKDNEYEAIGGSKISQQENLDEVQHNVIKSDAVVGPNDKSDSTTSNSISSDTQEAVNALLYGLRAPMNAQPLQIVIPQQAVIEELNSYQNFQHCIMATRDCLFPLHRIYRPLSTADDQQRTTTGRMPMNDDRVKLPINANPVVVHDPLRFNQGGQSDPYSFARDTMQNGTAEAAVYNSKKLEDAVHEMGLKLKHHEENISFLKAQKNRLDNSILDMHVALCKYQTASESGSENEELSHVQSEEETLGHIFVHEKSAAGIWYELKRHHGTQASHLPLMKDVVGIVAMLGNVDDDNLSRLLSDYLGLETMLAIVCKTCDGIKALETYDKEGHINKTLGLHGLGASIGKPLDGRFLVICLEKLRPYADDFIADDPQRRLDILKPRLPNGDSPPGFLGFAVNMVNIDSVNLYCATSSGHGLRETLFYNLFSRLHVYKTREDMLQALPCIRHGAISLDGGMIKHNGVFSLGKREINVKFPKSSGRSNLPQNYFEIERQIKEMRWKKERTVEDMQREQALLERSRFNFDIKKQEYLKFLAQSSTYATQQSFKQEGST